MWDLTLVLILHITPGAHLQEHAVNKQLNDKERVAAALVRSIPPLNAAAPPAYTARMCALSTSMIQQHSS
eukprot:908155-Rhodomonas_salina.3